MGVPSAGRPGQFLASPCWKSPESLRSWLADHSWRGGAPAMKGIGKPDSGRRILKNGSLEARWSAFGALMRHHCKVL
jgi:hypothetical protein